jgi:hypothetical protein
MLSLSKHARGWMQSIAGSRYMHAVGQEAQPAGMRAADRTARGVGPPFGLADSLAAAHIIDSESANERTASLSGRQVPQ